MSQKIVINKCHGGFGLSEQALRLYETTTKQHGVNEYRIERDDRTLVNIVETLGDDANGRFAKLKVVEIPDDVNWVLEEYDGLEWIAEQHREWR